jgi:hypothetical protein
MSLADVLGIAGLAVSVLSLVIGTTITIIVYQLGRKLDFRTRMHTWDELRDITRKIGAEMHDRDLNTEVLLLNADRYEREYDGGNRFTRHGHVQLREEYMEVHHNGISFLIRAIPSWTDADGNPVLHKTEKSADNVLEVGFVPFEYIEYIDPNRNEYKNSPLFYVHFRGRGRVPFKSYTYHQANSTPVGPRKRPYYPQVSGLGVRRISRLQGWADFWRAWWNDREMRRSERRADRNRALGGGKASN